MSLCLRHESCLGAENNKGTARTKHNVFGIDQKFLEPKAERELEQVAGSYTYFADGDVLLAEITPCFENAVGHKRVSKEFIERCQIPLPPLSEQHRIVAILDEAFAGLATATGNAEKNLKNARELFESALNSAFRNEGDLVSLSTLASDITDGDHMPPPKAEKGVPFITISNIEKDTHKIDFADTFKVPQSYFANLKDNRKPRRGDLISTP